jgi:exopolyphosphatase/guanosine-5'-triphosphate,3'-diphosphate pyrophosphatase
MRVAALDLGSNTFLLLIADMNGRDIKKVVLDETRVTRLGQGVNATKRFHPDALARAELALAEFSDLIRKFGCEKVVAVATSAARDAENGPALLEMGGRFKIPIHIISGDQEAGITFDGATCDLKDARGARVIDVGGGSTEIIGLNEEGKLAGESVDVGSVRLTEKFITAHPCPDSELISMQNYAREQFGGRRFSALKSTGTVVAVAGTPTSLVCLELEKDFREDLVNGYRMPLAKIWKWRDRLAALSVPEREELPGMPPNRADVLVAGSTILATAVEALGAKEILVSTKGVRYGVARAWQSF